MNIPHLEASKLKFMLFFALNEGITSMSSFYQDIPPTKLEENRHWYFHHHYQRTSVAVVVVIIMIMSGDLFLLEQNSVGYKFFDSVHTYVVIFATKVCVSTLRFLRQKWLSGDFMGKIKCRSS